MGNGRGKLDLSCLDRDDCSEEDLNKFSQNVLGHIEKVHGGGCVTDQTCSPISYCSKSVCTCKIKPLFIAIASIFGCSYFVFAAVANAAAKSKRKIYPQ